MNPRILLTLLLATGSVLSAQQENQQGELGGLDVSTSYKIRPLDLLRVVVFQEEDLAREVRVSKDNTIYLPLIGIVDLKNRSVREAEQLIRELYDRDYLVNPQINVTVVEYVPRVVNVMGAVNGGGAVVMPPEQNLTVMEAIARAGGFSRLAARGRIEITRTHSDGRVTTSTIAADDPSTSKFLVEEGDVINVRERVF